MRTAYRSLANTSADLGFTSTRVIDIPLDRKTIPIENIVDLDPVLACSVDRVAALQGVLTRCGGTPMYDDMGVGKDLKKINANMFFFSRAVVSL